MSFTQTQWENNEEMALYLEKEQLALQNRSASSILRARLEALERESFDRSLNQLLFGDGGGTAVPLSPEAVAQCVAQVLERQLQAEAASARQSEQNSAPITPVPPAADGQISEPIAGSLTNGGRSALLLQQLEQLVARFKSSVTIKT